MGDIHYNPWLDNSIKGKTLRTLGWAFGRKKKAHKDSELAPKRHDDVHISIYKHEIEIQNDPKKKLEKEVLAQGQGNWLSHIQFEGEITWRIQDEIPQWLERGDKMSDGTQILASDTDLREDMPFMLTKNWHEAEQKK